MGVMGLEEGENTGSQTLPANLRAEGAEMLPLWPQRAELGPRLGDWEGMTLHRRLVPGNDPPVQVVSSPSWEGCKPTLDWGSESLW